MKRIFVDTWAWYALINDGDSSHHIVEQTNSRLLNEKYVFVTTNYVLGETVTLMRYKVSHSMALDFWHSIQELVQDGLVELVRVSEVEEVTEWEIFEKYSDQDFSFVDCTSFAVMQNLSISEVFTGDHHFATMGFILVP